MRMEGWVLKTFQQLHNKTAAQHLKQITPLLWVNFSFKCIHIIPAIIGNVGKTQLIIHP